MSMFFFLLDMFTSIRISYVHCMLEYLSYRKSVWQSYLYVVLRNEVERVGREKDRREETRWTVSTTASMRRRL